MSSAQQQVPRLTFPTITRSTISLEPESSEQQDSLQADVTAFYSEADTETLGIDGIRRASDLYSPELNLEAHRTAQEVTNYIVVVLREKRLLDRLLKSITKVRIDPNFSNTRCNKNLKKMNYIKDVKKIHFAL